MLKARIAVYTALALSVGSVYLSLKTLKLSTTHMSAIASGIGKISADAYFVGCMLEHDKEDPLKVSGSCKLKSKKFSEPLENISKQGF